MSVVLQSLRKTWSVMRGSIFTPTVSQLANITYFKRPPDYSHIELPEKPRLPILPKVPTYIGVKIPKMKKGLKHIRGPELIHDKLLLKQYGIIALTGGRLKFGHLEMIRNTLSRQIDQKRMFLQWRIDAPWQAISKRSQGTRMGGGKGNIHHYVTPVKAHRVIVELGGKCDYEEVEGLLSNVAHLLPFKAMAVSHKMLEKMQAEAIREETENQNRYTMKYLIQNNIQNCQTQMRKIDLSYFGKYL
ncbi:39S ribosomal protein L16, mitochondrial [Nilaparvata lugens]|uniref:39S ribosomal protein L16, mitochondrial n=1 Tax=Nilaparvata lugens TaxID=108931 RepID=UPI00193D691A|nr:39S ribosomal protein L16, mitochondrial [Nilaparvata lugens]